jgi:hypothetical protein
MLVNKGGSIVDLVVDNKVKVLLPRMLLNFCKGEFFRHSGCVVDNLLSFSSRISQDGVKPNAIDGR